MAARSDTPVVIEVALNGGTRPERNPHVPLDPEAQARDALTCLEAGAAIVHQHDASSDPDEMARCSLEMYRIVLAARPDAILYPTTAWGGPIERRWAHHLALHQAGVLRCAFVDPGSVNLAATDDDGRPRPSDFIYTNSYREIRWKFEQCEQLGLGPSMAIFEPGFLRTVLAYEQAGRMPAGAFVKLYFGGGGPGGLIFGLPPTRASLDVYLAMLDGSSLPWAVAVLSGDVVATGMARWALEAGGHVRVGLEDHLGPRTPTNVELVREVVALAAAVGRPVASPTGAAAVLGLPGPAPGQAPAPAGPEASPHPVAR